MKFKIKNSFDMGRVIFNPVWGSFQNRPQFFFSIEHVFNINNLKTQLKSVKLLIKIFPFDKTGNRNCHLLNIIQSFDLILPKTNWTMF